jgi:hypothetical protein
MGEERSAGQCGEGPRLRGAQPTQDCLGKRGCFSAGLPVRAFLGIGRLPYQPPLTVICLAKSPPREARYSAGNHLQQLWEGTIMRATIALACTIVAAQLLSATGPAQAAPKAKAQAPAAERWCLRTESGGSDCTYHSLAQCRATNPGQNTDCWRSRREHKGTPGR